MKLAMIGLAIGVMISPIAEAATAPTSSLPGTLWGPPPYGRAENVDNDSSCQISQGYNGSPLAIPSIFKRVASRATITFGLILSDDGAGHNGGIAGALTMTFTTSTSGTVTFDDTVDLQSGMQTEWQFSDFSQSYVNNVLHITFTLNCPGSVNLPITAIYHN